MQAPPPPLHKSRRRRERASKDAPKAREESSGESSERKNSRLMRSTRLMRLANIRQKQTQMHSKGIIVGGSQIELVCVDNTSHEAVEQPFHGLRGQIRPTQLPDNSPRCARGDCYPGKVNIAGAAFDYVCCYHADNPFNSEEALPYSMDCVRIEPCSQSCPCILGVFLTALSSAL